MGFLLSVAEAIVEVFIPKDEITEIKERLEKLEKEKQS